MSPITALTDFLSDQQDALDYLLFIGGCFIFIFLHAFCSSEPEILVRSEQCARTLLMLFNISLILIFRINEQLTMHK